MTLLAGKETNHLKLLSQSHSDRQCPTGFRIKHFSLAPMANFIVLPTLPLLVTMVKMILMWYPEFLDIEMWEINFNISEFYLRI